jgi:hypothetical protein
MVGPFEALASPAFSAARKSEIRAKLAHVIVDQVRSLFLARWVGLEGVLAVSSYAKSDLRLFEAALREDPRLGVRSMYQVIAGADHEDHSDGGRYTFLTLPGVTAVLSYSGSATFVAFAMFCLTGLLRLIEHGLKRLTENEFLTAIGGVSIANVLAQLAFPYLALIFILQLILAGCCLAAAQWLDRRRTARVPAR